MDGLDLPARQSSAAVRRLSDLVASALVRTRREERSRDLAELVHAVVAAMCGSAVLSRQTIARSPPLDPNVALTHSLVTAASLDTLGDQMCNMFRERTTCEIGDVANTGGVMLSRSSDGKTIAQTAKQSGTRASDGRSSAQPNSEDYG